MRAKHSSSSASATATKSWPGIWPRRRLQAIARAYRTNLFCDEREAVHLIVACVNYATSGTRKCLSIRDKESNLLIVSDSSNLEKAKTNAEIRQWYLQRIATIPQLNKQWIEQGISAQERAERAWLIRHEARLEARSMMADPDEVQLLRARDFYKYGHPDGPTFDFLVERLRAIVGEAVYEIIIDGSYRTDAELNRKLGL